MLAVGADAQKMGLHQPTDRRTDGLVGFLAKKSEIGGDARPRATASRNQSWIDKSRESACVPPLDDSSEHTTATARVVSF